jgi:hypothetical protein
VDINLDLVNDAWSSLIPVYRVSLHKLVSALSLKTWLLHCILLVNFPNPLPTPHLVHVTSSVLPSALLLFLFWHVVILRLSWFSVLIISKLYSSISSLKARLPQNSALYHVHFACLKAITCNIHFLFICLMVAFIPALKLREAYSHGYCIITLNIT